MTIEVTTDDRGREIFRIAGGADTEFARDFFLGISYRVTSELPRHKDNASFAWEITVDIERFYSHIQSEIASRTKCDLEEVRTWIDDWTAAHHGRERGRFVAAASQFKISPQTAAAYYRNDR